MTLYTQFFTTRHGARIAYARTGQGLPLIYLPPFINHLELMWDVTPFRTFNEALASRFTLIRYDRYGCGFSDRNRTDFSPDVDLQVLEDLVEHLRLRRFALLGISDGGPTAIHYAVAHPRRVSHMLLFGVNWRVAELSPIRVAVNGLIRADWRIGANSLADYLVPSGDAAAHAWLAQILREATSPETAIGLSEASSAIDLSYVLPLVRTPTLVLNRRNDRLASLDDARELASRIPGAQLVTLAGDSHIVEFGDWAPVVEAIIGFADISASADSTLASNRSHGLSPREEEVLSLIAAGLTNREIAERLSVSVHTVERHTVNVYTKIGVRGRAAATAYAFQNALIPPAGTT